MKGECLLMANFWHTAAIYDTSVSTDILCRGEDHMWVWSGDPDYFPYEGMPCGCGMKKYNRKKVILNQIELLLKQLRDTFTDV